MEKQGRVSIKKTQRKDGMTEYDLIYTPPILVSKGNYLKKEHLNMASYTHPCNEIERRFNETVEQMVEEIRCFRYIQSVKRDFSFLSLNKDINVISYFESHKTYKGKECDAAIKSFKLFCDDECTFGDITVAFLTAYRKFLLKAKGEDGFRRYAQNTASTYLKHIKRLLKIAFADHLIDFDPSEEIEGIKWDHSCKRESLTEEEIEALKNAPFRDLEVKRAVELAVETGLRRGDVLNLKWENIKKSGGRCYLNFTIKKTGYKVSLPLSQEAVAVLGTIKKKGAIFPTLSTPILNHKVPQLIAAAGIGKHITFHCFRHTFAMRLLDKGVDIPTIAFLLGHKFMGSSLSYLHCTRDHLEEVIAKLER